MEPPGCISSSSMQNVVDYEFLSNLGTSPQACKKRCFEKSRNSFDIETKSSNQNCNSVLYNTTTADVNFPSIVCANGNNDLESTSSTRSQNSCEISYVQPCSSKSSVLSNSKYESENSCQNDFNNSNEGLEVLKCPSNIHCNNVSDSSDTENAGQLDSTSADSSEATHNTESKLSVTQEPEEENGIKDYVQYCDNKYSKNLDPEHPPLVTLQSGKVSVSDLTGQLWCEQQVVYSRAIPAGVRRQVMPEREEVATGKLLHRERELEIQSYVPLETTSAEDLAALPYSNTLTFFRRLVSQESTVVREVHVFGQIDGVPIFGVIDELRLKEGDDFAVELVEFKTRVSKTPPRKPQRISHEMQSMLYRYMYNDMVRGRCLDDYFTSRGLDLAAPLGAELSRSFQETVTQGGATPFSSGDVWTLGRVLEELRLVMAMLPFISRCHLHYCDQRDGKVFLKRQVAYNEPWMLAQVRRSLQFWLGHRPPEGVDVEEAHKCFSCHFQDHCGWVASKTRQLQAQNRVNFTS